MDYEILNVVPEEYFKIINVRVFDTESKHISFSAPEWQKICFEQLARKVNYRFCYMSKGLDFQAEHDRVYVHELAMQAKLRPAKFVISRDDRIWADNTHTSLAILLQHGFNVHINACNYYLVDFRFEKIRLIHPPEIPSSDLEIIIKNAINLQMRLDNGWRPQAYRYTIGELFVHGKYSSLQK